MGKLTLDPVRRQVVGAALVALGVLVFATGDTRAGVPAPTDQAPSSVAAASTTSKKSAPATPTKLIDINSASRSQLKTLPGIGDAEADKIIAGRPYLSKIHLVTEAGLPLGTYQSIRHQIVAVQNKAAKAKFKTLAGAPQAQPR